MAKPTKAQRQHARAYKARMLAAEARASRSPHVDGQYASFNWINPIAKGCPPCASAFWTNQKGVRKGKVTEVGKP